MIWLCGGALALNLLLVICLVGLLAVNGLSCFWQKPLILFEFKDGSWALGEIHETEFVKNADGRSADGRSADGRSADGRNGADGALRIKVRFANVDTGQQDFGWIDENTIERRTEPVDAAYIERFEWSPFIGFPKEIRRDGAAATLDGGDIYKTVDRILGEKLQLRGVIQTFEKEQIGSIDEELNRLRLRKKALVGKSGADAEGQTEILRIDKTVESMNREHDVLEKKLLELKKGLESDVLVLETAAGAKREVPIGGIARFVRPNDLGFGGRSILYIRRVGEFLFDNPRNLNTEGGIFPAIFGTVMMVLLMSFAVVPFGVLAALYLREYAKQGFIVRLVRIAVNNLAGVPSIVFGMFGLGFFVYMVGGSIDQLFFAESLPSPTFGTGGILWASLTLALLTVPVVIVASEEGLAAVPRIVREGSLALGATKFETTWRVVIPAAAPGILTGLILAMARAAGEVAPLMIVGMVKLATTMPLDGSPPFLHPERKFMHLGFHIYDMAFQNKNVDATKPLIFATSFLLIAIVTAMNLTAISLRNHLRRKYAGASV
ncbi:MAG: phosphate ABC transporter permease PstA [Planctomycetes bacterium]|nr:phosphate ABC transporter permease PstA [Planctomycetota bacterium]